MKIIFLLIFLSLFLLSETINEQIHALEDATPKKRVALMNDIKEQLISMNEAKRNQTLGALRAKFQAKQEETPSENHGMGSNNDSKTHENQEMHERYINEQYQHEQQLYNEREYQNHNQGNGRR